MVRRFARQGFAKVTVIALVCGALLATSGCATQTAAQTAQAAKPPAPHHELESSAAALAWADQTTVSPWERWKDHYMGVRVQGVRTSARVVAMTFDDGPTLMTKPVVDSLAKWNDHATFFFIGSLVSTDAAVYVVEHGDELANHSWGHPRFRDLTSKEASAEMGLGSQRIAAITGQAPAWFRSPFDRVWADEITEMERHGLLYADFSVNTHDWRPGVTDAEVLAQVRDELHPGAIIVMHEGASRTGAILPQVLSYIHSRGYKAVTLTELARLGPPVGPALTPDSNPKDQTQQGGQY